MITPTTPHAALAYRQRSYLALFGVLLAALLGICCVRGVVDVSSANASFGIEPGSFETTAVERDGTIDTRAGSHPYAYTVSFKFNRSGDGIEGSVRDIEADLPLGLVGDPQAVPHCTRVSSTPATKRRVQATRRSELSKPKSKASRSKRRSSISNRPPVSPHASVSRSSGCPRSRTPRCAPARATASLLTRTTSLPRKSARSQRRSGRPLRQRPRPAASLCRPERGRHQLLLGPLGTDAQAVPDAPDLVHRRVEHDRQGGLDGNTGGVPRKRDFRNALSLDGPEGKGNPVGLSGCEHLSFEPSFTAQPDTAAAEAPSGLNVDLRIPQPESPEGLAEANLREALVTAPGRHDGLPVRRERPRCLPGGRPGRDQPHRTGPG